MSGSVDTSGKRLKVFLSYSRKDLAVAEKLRDRLLAAGFEAYLDKHDILPGEPWQERLGKLIETADTVVFLLSPDSVGSKICDWEVNEAERLAKRILPVVIRDADADKVPGRLKRLNYIFMRDAAEEADGTATLGTALLTDIDWIREHTRLGEQAGDWERGQRTEALLLRGAPLAAAELWISERPRQAPEPTALHRDFIRASRVGEQARQEREKAQIAKTRRAQRRSYVVLTLMLAGVVGGGWGVYEFWKRVMINQSEFIASQAAQQVRRNNPIAATLLAIEALPDAAGSNPAARLLPYQAAAEVELEIAWRDWLGSPSRLWDGAKGKRNAAPAGHTDSVSAVTYSLDGRLVLTGSVDRTARLWEAATGKPVSVLTGHESSVDVAEFSSDGRLVMTASADGSVRVWETASGKEFSRIDAYHSGYRAVAISPDGRLIMTGRMDKTAQLWEAATGKLFATLTGHEHSVGAVAFSPNGRIALTGSWDATAKLWDVATGREIATLSGHDGAVRAVAFSPDGQLILTGTETFMEVDDEGDFSLSATSDNKVRLWDATTGNFVAAFTGHTSAVVKMFFSPDSRHILTTYSDGSAYLWDVETYNIIAKLAGDEDPEKVDFDLFATFSRDGRIAAIGSRNEGKIHLFEAATGRSLARLAVGEAEVNAFDFSPDGKRLAAGSSDGSLQFLEPWPGVESLAAPGNEIAVLTGFAGSVDAVEFSSDGLLVATGDSHNTVRFWEVLTGKEVAKHVGDVVAFSVGAKLWLSPDRRIWDVVTGHVVSAPVIQIHDSLFGGAFSHDGQLIATSYIKQLRIWDLTTGKLQSEITKEFPDAAGLVAISADNRMLLAPSTDYDSNSGKPIATARLWDVLTRKELATLSGHLDQVAAVAFSPDGLLALTGSLDNTARLWNAKTGMLVATLVGHNDDVRTVAVSPNGRLIATGSGSGSNGTSKDNTARIWQVATGRQIAKFVGHVDSVNDVAFSPDGRLVVTAGSDNTVRLWHVFPTTQALVDEVKSTVPRCLTAEERAQFHLSTTPPRWCSARQLWPYQDPAKTPPPPLTWDERLVAAWDAAVGLLAPHPSPGTPR